MKKISKKTILFLFSLVFLSCPKHVCGMDKKHEAFKEQLTTYSDILTVIFAYIDFNKLMHTMKLVNKNFYDACDTYLKQKDDRIFFLHITDKIFQTKENYTESTLDPHFLNFIRINNHQLVLFFDLYNEERFSNREGFNQHVERFCALSPMIIKEFNKEKKLDLLIGLQFNNPSELLSDPRIVSVMLTIPNLKIFSAINEQKGFPEITTDEYVNGLSTLNTIEELSFFAVTVPYNLIYEMKNLKILTIHKAGTTINQDIIKKFKKLKELRYLDVYDSLEKDIDIDNFKELEKLIWLNIGNRSLTINEIKSLVDNLKHLKGLVISSIRSEENLSKTMDSISDLERSVQPINDLFDAIKKKNITLYCRDKEETRLKIKDLSRYYRNKANKSNGHTKA